ncbi:MAG: DUF4810 domain-containing protein [Desulfobacterales bacterium]|nr:DUF4810 domain-containing protein [Desulfobacterales bacterium]
MIRRTIRKSGNLVLFFTVVLLCGGCVAKTMYYWGEYEDIVYDMYMTPGKADPLTQIEKLTKDIQRAEKEKKPVPPGIYMHLGMIYAMEGNFALAKNAFEEEKRRYPESTVLINRLQSNMNIREQK